MTCLLGADIDFVYGRKWNNHENEVEHRSIEKYLRTLMAKKLHGALLVPQKIQNEKTKENHHGNEAEPPSIEKYLRTLMAKKLHGALLVPQ